jgi:hypothetical protein
VIAISRDIIKGRTVVALTRSFDPATAPLTPLPNLIQMNQSATPSAPGPSGPPPRP